MEQKNSNESETMKKKDIFGELVATRMALQDALRVMSVDQRKALLDQLLALFTGLTERWASDSRSDFQRSTMNELERINFRIGQIDKSRQFKDHQFQKAYFTCIKCDIPFIVVDVDTTCPSCGNAEWFEIVHT